MAEEGDGLPAAPSARRRRQVAHAVGGVDPEDLPGEHDPGLELPRHARQVREDGAEHPPEYYCPRRRGEEEGEGDVRGGLGDEGGRGAGEGFGGEGGREVEERREEAAEGFEGEDA